MTRAEERYRQDCYLFFATGWAGALAVGAVARAPFGILIAVALLVAIGLAAGKYVRFRRLYARYFVSLVLIGVASRVGLNFVDDHLLLFSSLFLAAYSTAAYFHWKALRAESLGADDSGPKTPPAPAGSSEG